MSISTSSRSDAGGASDEGLVRLVELPAFPVGLADLDPDRRCALAGVLKRGGLHVALECSEPSHLLPADGGNIEVVVIGTDTLGPGVLDWVALLHDRHEEVKVVLVSRLLGDRPIRGAFDVGVDAVVHANLAARCLALAVRAAREGQLSVPRNWRTRFQTPVLSRRQKQILAMVVMGFSNRRIARTLGIAESTVKSHLTSAFRRLGVSSRGEATAVILDPENGLGPGILGIPGDESGDGRGRAGVQENHEISTNNRGG